MPFKDPAAKLAWQKHSRERFGYTRRAEYIKDKKPNRLRKVIQRGRPQREWEFIGVDGEGGGKDELGRQHYLLLRAGDDLLFRDNVPLTTNDCLGFLSGLDRGKCYVSYYFDYDVTMILRDATPDQKTRILRPVLFEPGLRSATYVGDYEIEYMARKHLKVKHVNQNNWITINDVGTFFQCKFKKALIDWKIATPEQLAIIEKGKAARKDFELMTQKEIEYNLLECQMLARLMEEFRTVCIDTGYVPSQWQGPGFLATAMLKQKGVVRRDELAIPEKLYPLANAAYYGGRFELFKIGSVPRVHEYDINSAYPTAMAFLPCLEHGSWRQATGDPRTDDIYLASIGFRNWDRCVADLPIRDKKTGSIYWPREGNGVYWSWEIEAAQRAQTEITDWRTHWQYHRECDCIPFRFVKDVYAKRQQIGKGTKGYALKLAINSLYGKTAQSIGRAPYANPVWAGLITAYTRARLIDTYSQMDSRNLVMLATDGLYSLEPLDLPLGKELGEWEYTFHNEMFFIAPGLYFYGSRAKTPKTRGVPATVMEAHEDEFRFVFQEWMQCPFSLLGEPTHYPSVTLALHAFIGMRIANHWNKPEEAGKWKDVDRKVSFDFRNKRDFAIIEGDHFATFPRRGAADLVSEPYSRRIGAWTFPWQAEEAEWNMICEEQPDQLSFKVDGDGR